MRSRFGSYDAVGDNLAADGATGGAIFSGTYTSGITLSNPATEKSATIMATGYVTNDNASLHFGDAIFGTNATAWNVTNFGTIQGGAGGRGIGVYFEAGGFEAVGTVTNGSGALLAGNIRAVEINTAGKVINQGTIIAAAAQGIGVALDSGGAVTNGSSGSPVGLITGHIGVYIDNGHGAVTNFGTINAPGGGSATGVRLFLDGSVVNFGTITAAGGIGVELEGQGTVTNAGTITGGSGTAVTLEGTADRLIVYPGAVFDGNIAGVAHDHDILELASARGIGTLTGFGFKYLGFSSLIFDAGAAWQVSGSAAAFEAATIIGFRTTDTLDVSGLVADGYSYSGGVLTLTDNGSVVGALRLSTTVTNPGFILTADGSGGLDIAIAGTTITGTYTSTVQLAPNSPATVAATGVVAVAQGDAVVNQPGYPATLANYGMITAYGAGGRGVYLNAGGVVTSGNAAAAGAVISGYAAGIAIGGGDGTIVDAGTIAGTGTQGVGVLLGLSGAAARAGQTASFYETLVNYGTISGYLGVLAMAGSSNTVTNAGTISGHDGVALQLAGGNDRLIVDPGADFQGVADGGGGASVLELTGPGQAPFNRAAPSVGTLAGIGSSFINFGTLVIDAGAAWEASGDGSSYPFVNDGTIIVANGIDPGGETLALGPVGADKGQHGVVAVGGGGVALFTGAAGKSQTLVFTDAVGTLQLADPGAFAARISGFERGDVIDLVGVAADQFSYAEGRLKLSEGGHTVAVLSLAGHFTKANFEIGADGNGGTDIVFAAAQAAESPVGLGPVPPEFWAVRG